MGSLRWGSLRDPGTRAETLGPNAGWDLAREDHQKAFLAKLTVEQHDEVHLSAMCGPWSNAQELNVHQCSGWKEYLAEPREWHHR
eukprot:8089395-Pyramimonas_sp.AAC.1